MSSMHIDKLAGMDKAKGGRPEETTGNIVLPVKDEAPTLSEIGSVSALAGCPPLVAFCLSLEVKVCLKK